MSNEPGKGSGTPTVEVPVDLLETVLEEISTILLQSVELREKVVLFEEMKDLGLGRRDTHPLVDKVPHPRDIFWVDRLQGFLERARGNVAVNKTLHSLESEILANDVEVHTEEETVVVGDKSITKKKTVRKKARNKVSKRRAVKKKVAKKVRRKTRRKAA